MDLMICKAEAEEPTELVESTEKAAFNLHLWVSKRSWGLPPPRNVNFELPRTPHKRESESQPEGMGSSVEKVVLLLQT